MWPLFVHINDSLTLPQAWEMLSFLVSFWDQAGWGWSLFLGLCDLAFGPGIVHRDGILSPSVKSTGLLAYQATSFLKREA